MSPRAYAGLVGAVLLLAGLIGLVMPVTATAAGTWTGQELAVECGTALAPAADDGDLSTRNFERVCGEAISGRRTWTWPLAGVGALVVLGSVVVRPQPSRRGGEGVVGGEVR